MDSPYDEIRFKELERRIKEIEKRHGEPWAKATIEAELQNLNNLLGHQNFWIQRIENGHHELRREILRVNSARLLLQKKVDKLLRLVEVPKEAR